MSELEEMIRRIVRDELAKAKPANDDQAPALITVDEYARARSISESTVRIAIREKRLESKRIGRAVRIPATAEIQKRVPVKDELAARALRVLLGGKGQ